VKDQLNAIISKIVEGRIPEIESNLNEYVKSYVENANESISEEISKRYAHYDKWLVDLSQLNSDILTIPSDPSEEDAYKNSNILWVDDHPENNTFQTQTIENLGASVDSVTTTEAALSRIRINNSYKVVISDMGRRGESDRAGLNMLQEMKKEGIETPVIFFCSTNALRRYSDEALSSGAFAITNSDRGLFRALTSALHGRGPIGVDAATT
jgi:CheY-like chemotaxis protein